MHVETELSEIGKEFWSYLEALCHKAKELGASEAVAILASDVVVDERVRLKCLSPRCPFYGICLVCPPNVMPIPEFKRILGNYHGGILIKAEAVLFNSPGEVAGQNGLAELQETWRSTVNGENQSSTPTTDYMQALRDSQIKLYETISQIESICFAEGYRFTAGLGVGGCPFCNECVGPQSGLPCRYPFKARPSMDALGIDVVTTAKRVGIPVDFTPNGARSWVALILVD